MPNGAARLVIASPADRDAPRDALVLSNACTASGRAFTSTDTNTAWNGPTEIFVRFSGAMTPSRLAECIVILGWTQREAGRQLSRQEAAIRQYLSGERKIPDADAAWIERLARFHERNPPPQRSVQNVKE